MPRVLRQPSPVVISLLAIALLVLGVPGIATNVSAQSARNLTVLVGAGEDTQQALAFFPQNVRIRQGDTVTWRLNGDELHTVSFTRGFDPGAVGDSSPLESGGTRIPGFIISVPGGPAEAQMVNQQVAWPTRAPGASVERYTGSGLFNSGILADEPLDDDGPVNEAFTLTFPTPGMYSYLCLVHPDRMFGTVEVVGAGDAAPDQAAIDTQAQTEIDGLMQVLAAANRQGDTPARREPGPSGSATWYVRAGAQDVVSGDPRAQILDFQPKSLVISTGDTVIWSARYFHTVSFVPTPPAPEFFEPEDQASGPPLIVLDPETVTPAKPSATYVPTQYFNSGLMGQFTDLGDSWSLTFVQPGVYEYQCLIHDDVGMKGTITVLSS